MKLIALVIFTFVYIALSCSPVDARGFRGGGVRFGSSRFSYGSSRFRVRVSAYRYRSVRTYRRYSRYSRSSYRYNSYGYYRTRVSAIGMGGLTVNKPTLLLAGSVYVAYNMRPNLYTTSGVLIVQAVDDYAICSGQVRWNPVSKNGTYVESDSGTNSSTTSSTTDGSPAGDGASITDYQLSTTTASLLSNGDVTYRYFLCPNDLMDGVLDDDDAFCCGPPGNQMCCDEEDFWKQDVNRGSFNYKIVIFVVGLFITACIVFPLSYHRKRISDWLGRCQRGSRPSTSAVIFQPVSTAEPHMGRSYGDADGSVKLPPARQEQPRYGMYPPMPPAESNGDLPSHPPPPYPGPFS